MMRSLFSAVSGLKSHQTRMDVIGNNIANVNTTGFKSSRVTFADQLSQTLSGAGSPQNNTGGTNPKQIGLGVGVQGTDLLFTDSSVQGTGKNTDLALSGNALFVVKQGNDVYYTRDGNFSFDSEGNYVMSGTGNYVQGWMANEQGVVTPGEATEKITIPSGKTMDATASSLATYTSNLRADTPVYKVSNVQVKYADGTSGTTTNYAPTEQGTIRLTTDTGFDVTLDGTAEYTFKTDEPIAGKKLWTSEVDSVTATGLNGSVDLTLAVDPTDPSGPLAALGLNNPVTVTSGTYRYGDKFAFSGTIDTVTAVSTTEVKLTFKPASSIGITEVTVPKPTTFSYQQGDTYNGSLKINSISNFENEAMVKAKNGQSATGEHFQGLVVNKAETDAVCKGIAKDGNVKVVHRTSGWSFNGKEVESATIQTTDGQSLMGMVGKAYMQDDLFSSPLATLFNVYDTQGREHQVTLNFTRVPSEGNTWELSIGRGASTDTITESDFSTTNIGLSSTKLVFDENGRYKSGEGTVTLTYTNPNGAEDSLTVALNLSSLTQYAGSSTIKGVADGNAAGTLKSVQVDSSGMITGTYTNGIMRNEAQVAVAQFNNASGLTKTGGNLYQMSNNSGKASVHTAADVGATITSSALEMSNVDIANEFSDMIITQRGFQSNSKVITVDDEMLETVIGMKR